MTTGLTAPSGPLRILVEMDDYGMDIDEAAQVIDSADVLVIRFAILDNRLLLDSRCNEFDGPCVAIVPKAESAQARFKEIKRMRPRFPLPEKIMSFIWPRQMDTFRRLGLWDKIESRMVSLGGEVMRERCQQVFDELLRQERAEVLSAIRGGEDYQSLWERSG